MSFGDFSLDLSSLDKKQNEPDKQTVYDLLIVGGGPAAMTAALYAARKLMKIAMITYDLGGQVGSTSWIENYMGFQAISGKELVDKFVEQVDQFKIPILTGNKLVKVEKEDELFRAVLDNGDVYQGRTLILSTGKRDRKLGVPGEEKLVGKGVAYCSICDAPFFKEKKVIVVGGGNSALTAAQDLLKITPHVTLVNYTEGWQADRIMLESVKKYDTLNMLDSTEVIEIKGDTVVTAVTIKDRKTGKMTDLDADGIFIEIGLIPNSEPVKGFTELNENGEVIVDCHCKTIVPGFYGAGDVTTVPYKQIIISSGEGAKAALAAYDYLNSKGLL